MMDEEIPEDEASNQYEADEIWS